MNIRKTLQAPGFSFIVLNLVEKSVLHILLIVMDYEKSAVRNKQEITSTQSTFKKIMKTPERLIFSFAIANLVNKGILYFLITTRVTSGKRGRVLSSIFLKIGRRCPDFEKKCPDFGHLWVKFLI